MSFIRPRCLFKNESSFRVDSRRGYVRNYQDEVIRKAEETSRDRSKSAPYLRLKNSKRTSKCQSILFYSTRKKFNVSQCRKTLAYHKQAGNGPSRRHIQGSKIAKGLQNFQVLVNWDYFYEKKIEVSQCRKNWKGGPFGIFQHPFRCKTPKKIEGGKPFGRNFFLKSRTVPKKLKVL